MFNQKFKNTAVQLLEHILPGNQPDFLIVGAQKTGTTSLHYYLDQHPDLCGSRPKEVCYFHFDKNYDKGEEWYKKAFINYKQPFKKGLFFEATPEYLYHAKVPSRIANFNPGMKLIILMREPIRRAFAAWTMYRNIKPQEKELSAHFYNGNELDSTSDIVREFYLPDRFPSFEQCIQSEIERIESDSEQEEPGLLRRGIYLPQIQRYHQLFDNNQILLLGFNEFITQTVCTLNRILDFLGLPASNWSFLNRQKRNTSWYRTTMKPETKQFLKNFYQPYNEELFSNLGYKPDW